MKEHTAQTLLFSIGLAVVFIAAVIGIFINVVRQPYTTKIKNTDQWIIHSDISVNHLISLNLMIRNSKNKTLMALVTTSSELQDSGDDFDELKIGDETFAISDIWKMFLNKRNTFIYNRQTYNINNTLLLRGDHMTNDKGQRFSSEDGIRMRKYMLGDFIHKVLQNRTGKYDLNYEFQDDYLEKSYQIIKSASDTINFLVLGPVTNLAKTLQYCRERDEYIFDKIGKIVLYGGTTNQTDFDGEYNMGFDVKSRDVIFSYDELRSKIYLFPVNYVAKTPLMDASLVKFTRLFADGCEKKMVAISKQPTLIYDIISWWLNSYSAQNSTAEFTDDYLQHEIIFNNEVVSSSSLWLVDVINTFQQQFIDWSKTTPGYFRLVTGNYITRVNLIRKIDWYKYFGFLLHKCVYA
ncbi:predicted protein [Naegleria gruberi]|uniref:Predicted protein n=1 Tax=Naegleria gruberi TaxID=5762 RepID=D2VE21_NAEGR|nr:uncharacterized protein NAEGRDRAFT_67121 [Naegleria gruberi]EFC45095.1 predicted protein [Naegleria gruberi]|eukprot:XP_002677839.1 predicted protein [Naegleria gruberi strain NEG-M]